MFKIVAKPRAWWPVTWSGVSEEGEIVTNTISMRFMLHKADESFAIMTQARDMDAKARLAMAAGDDLKVSQLYAEGVKLFACDWRDVAIDDGTEQGKRLDWNDENLAVLMNEPGLFDVIMESYKECQRAGTTISRGN